MVIGTQDTQIPRMVVDGARHRFDVVNLQDCENGSRIAPRRLHFLRGSASLHLAQWAHQAQNHLSQAGRPQQVLVFHPPSTHQRGVIRDCQQGR